MSKSVAKVVTVGSLHYDIFVEAPHRPAAGETVAGHRWYPKFGGKGGNQAIAAARAGARSAIVSAVGNDGFAPLLFQELEAAGVQTAFVSSVNEPTGMSVAIADADGDYGAVIVSGANLRIDPTQLVRAELWSGASHLMLQNEVNEAANTAAAWAARERGVTVCLNAAPWRATSEKLLDLVDILVVNALEAEALCGIEVAGLETAGQAARALADRFATVVVTAGGDGVAMAAKGKSITLPAQKISVVSTHGAGDCFIGTFVGRLAAGDDREVALEAANSAAARHVSRARTYAPVARMNGPIT